MNIVALKNNRTAFYLMLIGLFMAILDIQIVASSLNEIQGALAASSDEINWVQTAYMVAEIVMIPMTGWLSRLLSTRILFCTATLMFTLMSIGCAFSTTINTMLIFRVIQGFFGGAMIPSVFSAMFFIFKKEEQNKASILAGMVATLAPTLGPTLGGLLTSAYSWHWLFLINVIPGIIVTVGIFLFLDLDKPDFSILKNFDYQGFFLIAICLGCNEIFLEKGNEYNWFDSNFIRVFCGIAFVSFILLVVRELTCENPIVDFRAFKDRNFSIGCLLSFSVGVGLYGIVYLLPTLLIVIKNYNSLQIGHVMFLAGAAQLVSGVLVGFLSKKLPPKTILFIGILFFGIGVLLNGQLTTDVSFEELIVPQVVRGLAMMLCFVPMTNVALGYLPPSVIPNASGLYNLMRNLGGAIGMAILSTLISNRMRLHFSYLGESLNYSRLSLLDSSTASAIMDPTTNILFNEGPGFRLLARQVTQQAYMLAYNDVFTFVGAYLLCCLGLLIFVKPVESSSDAAVH